MTMLGPNKSGQDQDLSKVDALDLIGEVMNLEEFLGDLDEECPRSTPSSGSSSTTTTRSTSVSDFLEYRHVQQQHAGQQSQHEYVDQINYRNILSNNEEEEFINSDRSSSLGTFRTRLQMQAITRELQGRFRQQQQQQRHL